MGKKLLPQVFFPGKVKFLIALAPDIYMDIKNYLSNYTRHKFQLIFSDAYPSLKSTLFVNKLIDDRGVVNGKAGKAATLPKFSDKYVNPISIRGGGQIMLCLTYLFFL